MTRYLVDPGALGTEGRRVRCARCQHTWHADPPRDEPESFEAELGEPTLTSTATDTEAETANEDQTPVEAEPARRRGARAQLPAVREERSGKLWIAWILLVLIVAGIVAAGYVYRSQVVEIWPPAGRLYQTIGLKVEPPFRLRIERFDHATQTENAKQVLLVTGNVINEGKFPEPVPPLRVTLFDKNGREVAHWTAQTAKSVLQPGEEAQFSTKLVDPPQTAQRLWVTFGE